MKNFFYENGAPSGWRITFLTLLLLWCASLFFKNAVYQISFAALNLFFLAHLLYFKNYAILSEILKKTRFIAICFVCVVATLAISNLLNEAVISKKAWQSTLFFVLRYGAIFLALCYFYKLKFFDQNAVFAFLFVGLGILSASVIYQFASSPDAIVFSSDSVRGGLSGALSNRNILGLFMGFGLCLSAVAIRRPLALKFATLFLFAFFMIFSFSRAAWVGAFCALAFYGALNLKSLNKKYLLFTVGFISLFAVLLALSPSFEQRLAALFSGDSSGRTVIWSYILEMAQEKPILGYGLGSYINLPGSPVLEHPEYNAPHNLFLEILLYSGALGLIFYGAILFSIFKECIQSRQFGVLTLLIYLLIDCQFDHGAYLSKEALSLATILSFLAYRARIER